MNLSSRQQASEEWEQELQALNHHTIVSVADAGGTIVQVNELFCQISGYSRQELLGQNHRLIKSNTHDSDFYRQMWQTISRGQIWQGEICNRAKNGQLYWVESTIVPFVTEEGTPYRYISIRTDVTRIKQMEQQARKLSDRLRRSQIFANIGTWDWNIATGELYWSERIASLFGYPSGELETSYENFLQAIHPEDRDRVVKAVNRCISEGAIYNIEHRVLWPSGEVYWVQERGDVIRNRAGEAQNMLGVVLDIHERKMAELALLQAEEMAHLGHWQANLVTGELEWSAEIYRIFGYEPYAITPSIELFEQSIHPDDRALVSSSESAAQQCGVHEVVHRILRPDGEVRYVHERGEAQFSANGEMVRLIGTVQDVTERQQVEQQLALAKEAAEEANRAKSTFIANMSHEIRTPMNAIIGLTDLLLEEPLRPKQHKQLTTIATAAKLMLTLLNDVLDLSKLEGGKLELEQLPFSLQQLLDEVRSIAAIQAQEKGLYFELWIDHAVSDCVVGDPTRLRQIILNLAVNAVKFTTKGGVIIGVKPTQVADRLYFSVSDTGIGIDSKRLERIFERFAQADESISRQYGGSGLGTTISRDLVELMGGRIWVESELGKGSCFQFELPLPRAETDVLSLPNSDIDGAACETSYPLTLLLAEDIAVNRELIIRRLKQHQIVIANDGEQAVELWQQQPVDLILMDMLMPKMDGLQAVRRIRQLESQLTRPKTPIVMLTANAMPEQRALSQAAGADEFLTKPIDFSCLNRLLQRYCRQPLETEDGGGEKQPPMAGLDYQRGLALWGDEVAYCRALSSFCRDYQPLPQQLQQLSELQRWDELAALCHTLKGVSANLALDSLNELFNRLQQRAAAARPPQPDHYQLWQQQWQQLQSWLAEATPAVATTLTTSPTIDQRDIVAALQQLETVLLRADVDDQALATLKSSLDFSDYRRLERAVEEFEFEQALAIIGELSHALYKNEAMATLYLDNLGAG
ncbi:PAS domain S-box protein [Ectothiorhodospiraceae bacterium BW-2]|nr:PAS domain S-box protein [Ectothiorhodospiraceae bacterium BW-2]